MEPNALIGVFFHWLGGLSSASFYVPYKRIKQWSWEIFWIVGGVFSWLIMPWFFAWLNTSNVLDILSSVENSTLFWCWFWGSAWGLGGLTFGLTMRYLGLSLGMAIALGLTTVIGTLGPPIFNGTMGEIAATQSGQLTLGGIFITVIGIIFVAKAGNRKQQELGDGSATSGVPEFNLKKGILIATFSGVMSSCFAWGLEAGQPIRDAALASGVNPLWQGLPVLCVVLAGGLTTNLIWCAFLIIKNKAAGQLIGRETANIEAVDANQANTANKIPLLRNYLLAALGGTLWYFQFFFYTMGESQMGRYGFSSWTLHMASIILFSTLWGFFLNEWLGSSKKTKRLVWTGIGLLVGATVIIGIGNMLSGGGGH